MKISANIVSSLEKCRYDLAPADYPRLKRISALRGERINFQLIFKMTESRAFSRETTIECESDLAGIRLRTVKNIHTDFDTYPDDPARGTPLFLDYPGKVYPDILEKMPNNGVLRPGSDLTAIWADILINCDMAAGEHKISLHIKSKDEIIASESLIIDILDESLAEPDYICTNWFHVDCLAEHYGVPIYSERHFEIIEGFVLSMVQNGINTLFVPVLTPPLDTDIGHYRPTTQLAGIKKDERGYSFDFKLLDRYLEIGERAGIKYFEMSHIFSQWGAKYAPKVMAEIKEKGKWAEKRIFGWDTPGTEGAYPEFLRCFIPALRAHLAERGVENRCIFHISDEPTLETLEGYRAAKNIAGELLQGAKTVDACSHPEFFEMGLMDTPVPTDTNMAPFLALDIPERWTYYCCNWDSLAPNRMIAYPAWRNRILGMLMYKYNITGFLQWAYNFYYDRGSRTLINPYTDATGGGWVNAGDTFVVYPGADGRPVESMRLPVFAEVFTDLRALKKCEEICGRDAVMALVEADGEITFDNYPKSAEYILELRRRTAELIKNRSK